MALKMEYTRLGKSGLKVSKVILGAMSYGSDKWQGWVLNEDKALPLLEHAYKVGINTWDTADVYSHGESERIIGKALKQFKIPRDNVTILSKCYFGISATGAQSTDGERMTNRSGLSRKHILTAVDNSVERLGTYIDVLQIHRLDKETPKEEIMKALNDVIESGKVRYIGASSMYAWEFQQLQNVAEKHGWHRFISMQNYYNLLYREEEREMIPYCKDVGVGLIPWSPIARGALARPVDQGSERAKNDNMYKNMFKKKSTVDEHIIGRVEEVAKKRNVPMATVAMAWVIEKGAVPIVGLSSTKRIDEAVDGVSFKLTEEEIKYLEDPYEPKAIFGH
ncbi:MAG: hypothetical protein M1814_004396 [Vezdaea aestivalis]|nr:MAG: hypothetical protein M1814_004396 [Vezdaea aestivalis]